LAKNALTRVRDGGFDTREVRRELLSALTDRLPLKPL
jgi:hypothetical protein